MSDNSTTPKNTLSVALSEIWNGVTTWYTAPGDVAKALPGQAETNARVVDTTKSVWISFKTSAKKVGDETAAAVSKIVGAAVSPVKSVVLVLGAVAILGFFVYQFALKKARL